jgi:hypothetical protein
MRTCAILELGHRGCCAAADFAAAGAVISQRRVPRFPNDPVLRRCALNRWVNSRYRRPPRSKTTDTARDPSSRQRGHREGADKERHSRRDEGTVA